METIKHHVVLAADGDDRDGDKEMVWRGRFIKDGEEKGKLQRTARAPRSMYY